MKSLVIKFSGFVILFLMAFSSNNYGQNTLNVDSLVKSLISRQDLTTENMIAELNKLDSLAISLNQLAVRGDIHNRIGCIIADIDPVSSIAHFALAAEYFRESNNLPWTAIALLNTAVFYDERLHINDSAILYLERSLEVWKIVGDKTQQANILKYLGLLHGKSGNLILAKEKIHTAIDLFQEAGFQQGVAVCYFDLAGALDYANETDSALFYYNKSKVIQKKAGDKLRIFLINNKMAEIFIKTGNYADCKKIIRENETIFSEDYYWSNVLAFYKNCIDFYKHEEIVKKQAEYEKLLSDLQDRLKKEGVIIDP
jgi:tetratricopeptide (TPR) repeat protein